MKTVFIVPDPYDNSKNVKYENVESLEKLLHEYFNGKCPENLHVYHGNIAVERDVTPKKQSQVEYLEKLNGTFYIVVYPAWLQILYYAIVAIMAAYSVYTILTMPKANNDQISTGNNELVGRSNKLRVKKRIPDIFGKIRSYPDLISTVYTYYDGVIAKEVEMALLCVGRGYYQVHDCRDGETDVTNIDGCDVSVFNPGQDLISGSTAYKSGNSFTEYPLYTKKSSSVNGQTLEQANNKVFSTSQLYFKYPNTIRALSSDLDFSEYFSAGDSVYFTNATFGTADIALSGNVQFNKDQSITFTSPTLPADVALYQKLMISNLNVVIRTIMINEDGEAVTTDASYDISGTYTVNAISYVESESSYIYTIQLYSPKQTNTNWNYITDLASNQQVLSQVWGITLTDNKKSVTLDGTYSITSVSGHTAATSTDPEYFSALALSDPANVNAVWGELESFNNGSTYGLSTETIEFNTIANSNWVGWFKMDFPEAQGFWLNIYWSQGLFWQSKSGRRDPTESYTKIQYQQLDEATLEPIGEIFEDFYNIREYHASDFGRTKKIDFSSKFTGSFRFRVCKNKYSDSQTYDTTKLKDVYAYAPSTRTAYENVTVVRAKTVATSGALSVKERNLNLLVTRKLKVDGTGDLVATKYADQALINLALDQYVGRRSANEVDIEQIKAEIEAVKTYFSASEPTEFSYTFDDDSLSFEEQAGMIASACFCECYRFGNKLRLKFEKPQENSVLLFNHRNKVPQSEKRTYNFGIAKDYDGIELEYTDPDDDARVTYTIPTDGSAINPQKIMTSGIRNEAVAKTRAWREWNKLLYRRVSVEFDALDESNLLARNDRILVADNTLTETQDGEVIAQDGLTLTLSQNVDFEDGYTYYCFLQLSDGTVESIQCTAGEYTNQIVLVSAPSQALVTSSDRYVKTLYQVVKSTEAESQAFMLTELEPNDTMTNKLTAINYDARYYEKDHSFI